MATGDEQGSSTSEKTAKRTTKKTAAATATKSAASKKATTKKAPATKSPAKKAPAKRAAAKGQSSSDTASRREERASAPRAAGRPRPSASMVARSAVSQLVEMTGQEVEGITGLERTDDGWKVEVEVLELRRVPNTTDVLATYEVLVDDDGDLQGYRRLDRYSRGDTRSDQ